MAYVALPQGAKFLRKFPNCPNPAFQGVIQVRSEPSQGAVAVRFVTKETWPEIRRPFGSRGKLSPPSERLKMFRSPGGLARVMPVFITRNPATGGDSCGSADGCEREPGALRRVRRSPRAINAAKGRSGREVAPKNQGGNCPRKSKLHFYRAAGGPAALRWWKPDMSWPKGKSRAASRHSSACGAAGTSTLTSLASWAC
jgi:hypothetical protein